MFPNINNSKFWDDVRDTLAQREFPIRHSAYFEGRLAKIEVISSRRKDSDDDLDVEVIVTPYILTEDLDPDVEAGAREAFEEALESARPSIQFAAAQELERLDVPKASGHDRKNRTLLLRRKTGGFWTTLLPPGVVDRRGRSRFLQIPGDSVCSLEVRSTEAQPRQAQARGRITKGAAKNRESDDSDLARLRDLRSQTFSLPDRELTAVLEELPDGSAALTIRAKATELARATVGFRIGGHEANMGLTTDRSGGLKASIVLNVAYREVETCVPFFEILMPRPD
jgi:hypothetical protein